MKNTRLIILIAVFVVGVVLVGIMILNLINSTLDQAKNEQNTTQEVTTTGQTTTTDNTAKIENVTPALTTEPSTQDSAALADTFSTVKLSGNEAVYVDAIGVVKSKSTISVFPQTSAAIRKVNFEEGDYVKEGDVIAELTGANMTEHPLQKQYKIAQTTYNNAKDSVSNLVKTNNESLKASKLQLQSAISQASAIPYDLKTIEQNKSGLGDALSILQDTLNQTRDKNQRDKVKTQNDIDDLITSLNTAQTDRNTTNEKILDIQRQIAQLNAGSSSVTNVSNSSGEGLYVVNAGGTTVVNSVTNAAELAAAAAAAQAAQAANSAKKADLEKQLATLQATLKTQEKAVDDLYTAVDKAKYGYSTMINAANMSENQILAQIQTSANQSKVLDLTLTSTKTKLGYTGDSSDALKLAEQGYNTTQAQLSAAVDSAQNQLKLAELSMELAKDQVASLQVKAPFSGVITSMNLVQGQQVSPQASIAELINPKEFQLEVTVDPQVADKISIMTPAKVEIGGKWMEAPIKSIAPKVDDKNKQVKVVLQMPNIFFRANQNIKAQLPLTMNNGAGSQAQFVPLDAVTIATENQFVYVNDNGKAKRVEVKTGQITGDQIEILEGLKPTDEVIVKGAKNLIDGQSLTGTEAAK